MKVVFISNYFNHHQRELSELFYKLTDGKYYFIETDSISEERIKLGYVKNDKPDYVCKFDIKNETGQKIINDSKVTIVGSAPEDIIKERKKLGKLIFRYAERPLKHGFEPLKYFPRLLKWHMRNPVNKPIYMLCASAYTIEDYRKFGLFKNRTYKWGYFPETRKYENIEEEISKKSKTTILWCGRFVDWKHPDDAIQIAKRLKDDGYDFKLEFIGCGTMEVQLLKLAIDYDLDDYIYFHGSMSPDMVRLHMERAGIYLFTSDHQEGWGAVLNEAMNSGCAVVVSHAIGAVPYLIKDKKNGLVYKSGDINMLYEKVKYLLENPDEQERLGKAAYSIIVNEWNAEVAAERLIKLSECILAGEEYPDLYKSGPCSRAEIFDDSKKSKYNFFRGD